MTKFTIEVGPMGGLSGKIDGETFEQKGIALDKLDLLERMMAAAGTEVEYKGEYLLGGKWTKWTVSNIKGRHFEVSE